MESKGKNNTFWKPGMIVSVAMFAIFSSLVLVYALMPDIVGSKFTKSDRPVMEKWITILAVQGETVKDIKHVKGGYPFFCFKDKDTVRLKGHSQASVQSGKIYISDYLYKGPEGELYLKVYQGKNIKRIIEPREKIEGAAVREVKELSPKATVRYLKNDKAPYKYAITFSKQDASVMVYAQSPNRVKDLDKFVINLSSFDLCE